MDVRLTIIMAIKERIIDVKSIEKIEDGVRIAVTGKPRKLVEVINDHY